MKKILSVVIRSSLEQVRRPVTLLMIVSLAPLFVFIYWMMSTAWVVSYDVGVLNLDQGTIDLGAGPVNGGAAALEAISKATSRDSIAALKVREVTDRVTAEKMLSDRKLTALFIFPVDFSNRISALQGGTEASPVPIQIVGDITFPNYMIGAAVAGSAVDAFIQYAAGRSNSTIWQEEPLRGSGTRTDFELSVPGLLVFSVVMMLFQIAMLVARDVQNGTLKRLRLTRLKASHYLAGLGITQLVLCGMLVILTFATAIAFGYSSEGSIFTGILIGVVTGISVIGVGLVVAAFSETETDAFVYANFPLFLMMFFSGAMFPFPRRALFAIGSFDFAITDLLPPTHAVNAMNKVLNLGGGFSDITGDLTSLGLLSVIYFGLGVWLFAVRQLKR
jgi:ABC-2 type transport system permease protein